jgi:hypothetical protein
MQLPIIVKRLVLIRAYAKPAEKLRELIRVFIIIFTCERISYERIVRHNRKHELSAIRNLEGLLSRTGL